MKTIKAIIVIFSSLLLVHCSNNLSTDETTQAANEQKIFGTCDHTGHSSQNQRQCREWIGDGFEAFDLSVSCNAIESGVFSEEDLCSTDNLLGVCVMNEGEALETRFYYYSDQWNESSAGANCSTKAIGEISTVWRAN